LYVPKTANRKGQADKVIEFIPANSPEAQGLNKEYVLIKDRERPKFLPNQIISKVKELGYNKFTMHKHTKLWQSKNAKEKEKGFGVEVANTWYWYDNWLKEVIDYCGEQGDLLK